MNTVLHLMLLYALIALPIVLVLMAVGYMRKKRSREHLGQLPLVELQSKARALWPRAEKLEDVFASHATASTMYGTDGEALMETLLKATFAQKDDFEVHYRFLASHYTWLLQLLLRFFEVNWSWSELASGPNMSWYQLFYTETDADPAAPKSGMPPLIATTRPPTVIQRYPGAKDQLVALMLGDTLSWLQGIAQQQRALRQQTERAKSTPAWDAEIFQNKVHSRTAGLTTQSLREIHCPPAVLRKEIERLGTIQTSAPA